MWQHLNIHPSPTYLIPKLYPIRALFDLHITTHILIARLHRFLSRGKSILHKSEEAGDLY